uniref:Uncharacterized protein n=1 Tax=Cannabis sativa TaxID=3483 RepID=A0A803Q7R0_CANSA
MDPPPPEPVSYICGDCGMENTLKPGDVIQCRECGYRILYKKRTRRNAGGGLTPRTLVWCQAIPDCRPVVPSCGKVIPSCRARLHHPCFVFGGKRVSYLEATHLSSWLFLHPECQLLRAMFPTAEIINISSSDSEDASHSPFTRYARLMFERANHLEHIIACQERAEKIQGSLLPMPDTPPCSRAAEPPICGIASFFRRPPLSGVPRINTLACKSAPRKCVSSYLPKRHIPPLPTEFDFVYSDIRSTLPTDNIHKIMDTFKVQATSGLVLRSAEQDEFASAPMSSVASLTEQLEESLSIRQRYLLHSYVRTKRLRARIDKLQHRLCTIKARNKEELEDKIERLLYAVWIQNPDINYSILGSFAAQMVESFKAECGDAVAAC